MNKIISVQGKNLQLEIAQHKVKLTNNGELAALLACNTEAATDELVVALKTAFLQQNNREFDISNDSITVEIWGHMYAENFAAAVKSLSPFSFVDSLADKIIGHCVVINIGEPGHDKNRFIWYSLASFKANIAALLPNTIS